MTHTRALPPFLIDADNELLIYNDLSRSECQTAASAIRWRIQRAKTDRMSEWEAVEAAQAARGGHHSYHADSEHRQDRVERWLWSDDKHPV